MNNKIEELCNRGYNLEFGAVFDSAMENYKKTALYSGLVLLVFTFIFFAVFGSILASTVGFVKIQDYFMKIGQKSFPIENLIIVQFVSVLVTSFLQPFFAGFLLMARNADKGEAFTVSTMFSYYRLPFFSNLIFVAVIIGVLSSTFTILFQQLGLDILGSIIGIFIQLFTILTVPLIVFADLSGLKAISVSIKLVSKKQLTISGLMIIAFVIAILGVFGIIVGLFFTIPFVYTMHYAIYKNIIGFDDSTEIDQIGSIEN